MHFRRNNYISTMFMPTIYLLITVFTVDVLTCNSATFLLTRVQFHVSGRSPPVSTLFADINRSQNITKIQALGRNLTELCHGSLRDLKFLTELLLDSNGIEEISPGTFQNLPRLRYISLTNNKLEVIEEEVFNRLELVKLFLDGNSISYIYDGAFDGMDNLRILSLSSNRIKYLNKEWFKGCHKLTHLFLRDNEITSIPEMAFKNLQGRYVYENKFTSMLEIDLSGNRIFAVHKKAFYGLDGMRSLRLEDNLIETIPAGIFDNFTYMEFFSMGFNKLECLPDDLGGVLVAKEVFLDNNPFDCTCLKRIKNYCSNVSIELNAMNADRLCKNY